MVDISIMSGNHSPAVVPPLYGPKSIGAKGWLEVKVAVISHRPGTWKLRFSVKPEQGDEVYGNPREIVMPPAP